MIWMLPVAAPLHNTLVIKFLETETGVAGCPITAVALLVQPLRSVTVTA